MSPPSDFGALAEPVRKAAADWFARMHGPEAEASRPAFQAWLAEPAHARAYEQLTARWEQSAFMGATHTGRTRTLRRVSLARRHPILALAASITALAAGAALLVPVLKPSSSPPAVSAAAAPRPIEATSSMRDVLLADGSRVSLDRASLLLVAYTPAQRGLVLVRGRARFDVAHEANRPFVVTAAGAEVIAHGTLFDVAVRGETATVTLLNGAIAVRQRGSRVPPRLLRAGEQIVLSAHRPLPLPIQAPSDSGSWLPGMIELRDMPLAEAARRIEARGGQIRFGGDTGALRISGAFRAGDVQALADSAVAMFGLELERLPSGDLLLTRTQSEPNKSGG